MEEESSISLEMVWICVRRFWLLLILAALAGVAVAYYWAGCQQYQYSKTASVILRDAKSGVDTSSDKILQELGVDSSASNMANESCILKSTSLMVRTVEALGVNVCYWEPSRFRMIDLYKDTPFLVEFSGSSDELICELRITPQDAASYSVMYHASDGTPMHEKGKFNKPLQLPFANIVVHPTAKMNERYYGMSITVTRVPVLQAARAFLNDLKVNRPADAKDSSLLLLTLVCSNPDKTADVLDKLVEVYNQNSRDAKGESARKTEAFIRGRLAELGADLSNVDEKIADQRTRDEMVVGVEQTIETDYSSAQAITKEIFELQTQLKLAGGLARELEKSSRRAGLITLDSGVADTSISAMLQEYNEAYLAYQRVSGSAGSRNPVVVALLGKMQASLAAANTALDNYKNNIDLKIKELENKKKIFDERINRTSEHEQALTPLVREHKVKEELYMLLLKKEQENALSLALATPSAIVLETAHGSDLPVAPDTQRFMVIGGCIGFAGCMALLLGIGMLNNRVKTRRDLLGKTSLPVIAELPRLSRKERASISARHVLIHDEHSQMSESLHILRNNAESLVPRVPGQGLVYLFTSTIPGEGKTLVSANLAVTFAKTGRRVLLLDFDFRKRSLSHRCGGKGRKGITSLLLNHVSDAGEVLHRLPDTPYAVDIIYAGPPVPNPVTLLSQPKVEQLIADARKQYDIVILDCPPYNILADTAILAPLCDATLYLIRSRRINRNYISQVQKLVSDGKLPPLGFIINDVDFRVSSYHSYGYGYGYGYSYGSKKDDEKEVAEAQKDMPASAASSQS